MADSCGGQCTDKSEDKIPLHSTKNRNVDSNYVSEFTVPKMGCPSEERIVRMFLESIRLSIALEFDIPNRKRILMRFIE
jgi:hypothetical protein